MYINARIGSSRRFWKGNRKGGEKKKRKGKEERIILEFDPTVSKGCLLPAIIRSNVANIIFCPNHRMLPLAALPAEDEDAMSSRKRGRFIFGVLPLSRVIPPLPWNALIFHSSPSRVSKDT